MRENDIVLDIDTKMNSLVSIIIPLYNESETIVTLVKKILALPVNTEIIFIDDGSTDSSHQIIKTLDSPKIRLLYHSQRAGKGAAVQTGLLAATGDVVVIQDADLEYHPEDIVPLLDLITSGQAEVAYGVRNLSSQKMIIRWGNHFLTWVTNTLYKQSIHDMTTCYKVMPRELMQKLNLDSKGFMIDAEITAKLFKLGFSIKELPINYLPRYENKKLKLYDGFPMLWALFKYRFWKTSFSPILAETLPESAD